MDAREPMSRNLFHGLVNLATGFYHYRMNNFAGMQSQLGKGVKKLTEVPACCLGVEVAKLLHQVENNVKDRLKGGGFPEPLPQIKIQQRV